MALVNVGVQLAKAGKRVLLVDFDLEAPGLPTFSLKKPDQETPGLVEYITTYIETGEAADVKDYLYESEEFPSKGKLWIMPVGKQDEGYSNRLNSIDWKKLYSEQAGYLFFEDLKKQWSESIKPDYVLIDSRTGHSDVEGICTRQLPNAVTLLFFPNDQNLIGLKRIVSSIRYENQRMPQRKIRLHFAVSNVPDLDDEDQILIRTMQRFKGELGYKSLSAEIHHYNSLSLLNQEIFSSTHPNSRLTKEYGTLTKAITKFNLEDRNSTLTFLKSAHRNIQEAMYEEGLDEFQKKLEGALKFFSTDGEVLFNAALVYELLGDTNEALSLITNKFVDTQYSLATMYATRARIYRRLEMLDDVSSSLSDMLNAGGADIGSLIEATSLMEQLVPSLFNQLTDSVAFNSLSERDQQILAMQLDGSEAQLKAKISIYKKLLSSDAQIEGIDRGFINLELGLASIRVGDFEATINLLNPTDNDPSKLDIASLFNLSMAIWGQSKSPSKSLLERVLALHEKDEVSSRDQSANYFQCISLSYAIIGNKDLAISNLAEARKEIQKTTSSVFSVWTYSRVTPEVFLIHLNKLEQYINGVGDAPEFLNSKPVLSTQLPLN